MRSIDYMKIDVKQIAWLKEFCDLPSTFD